MSVSFAPVGHRFQVLSALRNRDFRLFWFGHFIAVSGFQMRIVTELWLIWRLTESEFLLGAVGLVEAVPAVLLTLFGGAIADKVDLRRLIVSLQAIPALALFVLATLVATELVQVWHIFAVAFSFGGSERLRPALSPGGVPGTILRTIWRRQIRSEPYPEAPLRRRVPTPFF